MLKIYELATLNSRAKNDPKGFIEESEAAYLAQIEDTAELLTERLTERPILLLNGPSSAGKTTTADRLCRAIERRGIYSQRISMDDYYLSRHTYSMPYDEENDVVDLESPLCMDLPLLSDHLHKLARGEQILVPSFDFVTGRQTLNVTPMRLRKDEIVIIEGIHSLNDVITGGLEEQSSRVYLSLEAQVLDGEGGRFTPEVLRFARRALRDARFRSASVEETIRQWLSIRRGERLYIAPYRHYAEFTIDTYLPYESNILYPALREALDTHADVLGKADLKQARRAADLFEPIDYLPYMPEASVLHEFVG